MRENWIPHFYPLWGAYWWNKWRFPQQSRFLHLTHNLNFGLSEIVEGTFLKIPIFRQNFEFSNFRPDFPLLRSKSLYFELILWVSDCILGVWTCILGVWTYTLGVWTYIACVGCLNLYFWASEDQAFWGPVNLEILKDQAFWYDLWIWKYWRTKHSGMTCESGNTEGLEPVDFRPISRPWDWNLWTSGPFQDHGLGMLGLLDHLGQDLFLANQAGWGVRGAIAPRWNQLYFINRDKLFFFLFFDSILY